MLVINTHCHYDHVAGNAGLVSAMGAVIAASDRDRAFTLAALAARDTSLAKEVGCSVQPYDVTRWLSHNEELILDDEEDPYTRRRRRRRRLRVLHTPGHTPDSLCLLLEEEDDDHQPILFVGDTLYPHAAVIVANADSDLGEYRKSLGMLCDLVAALPPTEAGAVRLACGHNSENLPASKLWEMRRLVDDAVSGTLRPHARSPRPGVLLFEREDLSFTVRANDPALRGVGDTT
mmetsp:Transcript_27626/g.110630  ORF Transcript_27626/g.110630 Transcript_27626/m.110630 type:complete len:233 (-) Transcript_27626:1312-2010(-)